MCTGRGRGQGRHWGLYHFRVYLQLQPRVLDAVSPELKLEKLPGADGITLDLLKQVGDEIKNTSIT